MGIEVLISIITASRLVVMVCDTCSVALDEGVGLVDIVQNFSSFVIDPILYQNNTVVGILRNQIHRYI